MNRIDLDPAGLPEELGAWYASHLGKIDSARAAIEPLLQFELPPVRTRLTRSRKLGAEALMSRQGYEVRLSVALPAILHFAFNSLMRTPHFMYGIGDAESEQRHRASQPRIPLALPHGGSVEQAITAITSLSRPRDEQRAAAAVLLAELAVAFCAYHELSHVLLGHVDALVHWNGQTRLLEFASRTRERLRLDSGTRMVWEYEADLLAANMLLQDLMAPDSATVFQPIYGAALDTDALSRFQAMIGATLVLFLLVAQVTPRERRTHPEPLVRFAAIANDSGAALVEQQPQLDLSFDAIDEAVSDVVLSTLSAWQALGLSTSTASPLTNLLTARRVVQRLERARQARHATYTRFARFYPFR